MKINTDRELSPAGSCTNCNSEETWGYNSTSYEPDSKDEILGERKDGDGLAFCKNCRAWFWCNPRWFWNDQDVRSTDDW